MKRNWRSLKCYEATRKQKTDSAQNKKGMVNNSDSKNDYFSYLEKRNN